MEAMKVEGRVCPSPKMETSSRIRVAEACFTLSCIAAKSVVSTQSVSHFMAESILALIAFIFTQVKQSISGVASSAGWMSFAGSNDAIYS